MKKEKSIVGVRPSKEEEATEFALLIQQRNNAMFVACEINIGFLRRLLTETRRVETKEGLRDVQLRFKQSFPKYYDAYSLLPNMESDDLTVAKECLYTFLGSKNVKTKLLSRNFLT